MKEIGAEIGDIIRIIVTANILKRNAVAALHQ
ncbi:protein of unknown function [Cupriavidus taiwanensis]|uniref:Uncharacterized protein n=1 Tax=Cupriavidus taiwanensis TaxID=164546 RepID=A0A9Q7USV2_9BURK|nr:protein of unknown function [Cupriavidus taiwanensis]